MLELNDKRGKAHPDLFQRVCVAAGLPEPVIEFRFCERKWRFDYSWPAPQLVALEVEGGVWIRGRHSRGQGYLKDMEKYNRAALLGWTVLRVTPDQLVTATTIEMIRMALAARGWAA